MGRPRFLAILGVFVQASGRVIPAAAVLAEKYAHDARLWWWEAACVAAATTAPLAAPKLAQRLYRGSQLDVVLRKVMEGLIGTLSDGIRSGNGHDDVPAIRVTAFLPKKRREGEHLVPRFRLTSAPGATVLEFGEDDFKKTRAMERGEALAGKTWDSGKEQYRSFKNMYDYPGDDDEKKRQWEAEMKRFDARPNNWSVHSRHVRSMWTFAIPGEDENDVRNPIAVFCVDSTIRDAFDVPGTETGVDDDGASSLLNGVNTRQAVSAGIVMTIHSGVYPRKSLKSQLRALVRRSDRPSK